MKTEVWKDIKGYEGLYQISNFGRLKSFKQFKDGKILKNTNKQGWYLTIVLQGKGKPSNTKRIHRLVAEYFIYNPFSLPVVNHKDLNKQNNYVDNLEWVTIKQNVLHAVRNNPNTVKNMNIYNKYIKPKRIHQYTINGEYINTYNNAKEAFRQTGVCGRNILQVARKDEFKPGMTRKQAGGYVWKFETKGTYVQNN